MSSPAATGGPSPSVPELTLRVIVIGVVLSVVMGAANVYLGLKVGMTVSASIPAAVVGMLVLRALSKRHSILEANQIQTAASAGESLAAGIIFTMPAMLLIGVWESFDWWLTTLIALAGGLLGILFMIPMRRVFVTPENTELKYPEGVACAAVLQTGEGEGSKEGGVAVVVGAAIGAGLKVLSDVVHLIKHNLEGAGRIGDRLFYFGGDVSPALLAVGFIVRLQVAVLIFIGGGLAWLLAIPTMGVIDGIVAGLGFDVPILDITNETAATDAAWTIWSGKVRYIGVGAMVLGGIMSIAKVVEGLQSALKAVRNSDAPSAVEGGQDTEINSDLDKDLPAPVITIISLIASAVVGIVYYNLTGHMGIAVLTTAIMLVMSFFFTGVASYIVGLVGNSNSPVSGMTITAVLFTGLMLTIFGFTGTEGMVATLGVAAIVCCAACTSGDVCNDLKTGQIVGATPWRQQIMQVMGVAVAAGVMAPVMQILHAGTEGGIGGKLLPAPQARLFASIAEGFFGNESLPWGYVLLGALVGVLFLIGDKVLAARGGTFRLHLMPIAVGMYLPFGIAPPILIGGLLAHWITKGMSDEEAGGSKGVLFGSGIIAGESLMGIGLGALAFFLSQRGAGLDALGLHLPGAVSVVLTLAAAAMVVWVYARMARSKATKS